jgi:hypothetical protein
MVWVNFSLRQFKLLHQVTKEISNLDSAVLNAAEIPESVARHLLALVRRGRAEIGDCQTVRLGFDDNRAVELCREVAIRSHDGILEIDTGTTTAAAGAWIRLGQSIAAALGNSEFRFRTGGTLEEADEVFTLLGQATSSTGSSEPSAG